MAYNPLLPPQGTNKWSGNAGAPPPGWVPQTPQGAAIENVQKWGNPDVMAQQNPLSDKATPLPTAPPAPAKFLRQGAAAATPPPAVNPNVLPQSGGTMTITGTPGATATIGPSGVLTENAGWRAATAPGTATGQGQTPGVGGTLNVMAPGATTRFDAAPSAPAGGVWEGTQGQTLRDQLTRNMNLAMKKANAPFTGERGTSEDTGGNRQQWAALAKEFGDTLSGGITAQGVQQGTAEASRLAGEELPSKIEANRAQAGYYKTHGEAVLKTAASAEERAANQLEIAGLKAAAGKYGDTATAVESLKGGGFAPNPQAIEAFNKGYVSVPGTKASKTGFPGFRTEHPAVRGHMIGPDWKPVMVDGKQKVVNGEPIYTDATGREVKPKIYGK